eukprot:CAMPEP_0202965276 /NCGR_PEP_ID=MMETSP1396-20130829/9309_1 /ASSEMBLY_ACC=CAM_ASM_000872 /TAXON_ID= /ORGANISM="Pseudokeronopsis sp., Strain Brazil" /LENGTH=50 /DNA_ID=CAMNT_0049687945 /DNA_START=702 /DNA_END=854 /DNA_ORIENTATION=-
MADSPNVSAEEDVVVFAFALLEVPVLEQFDLLELEVDVSQVQNFDLGGTD